MNDLVSRVCRAHAWQRALGHDVVTLPFCRIVRDPAHPNVWDANHVSHIRAAAPDDIAAVLEAADLHLPHCAHRLFVIDPATPPAFAARLALDGYGERRPTIQMVLDGAVRATPPAVSLRPVSFEADWQALGALLAHDHAEGGRTAGPLAGDVTAGILAGYRRKAPAYQFYLATVEGEDCAYGAGVHCDEARLGVVEDLFTLPRFRRRGIATAIIGRAVADLHRAGINQVMIGAHAGEPPARLYAALGFVPVCLTREYLRAGGTSHRTLGT